MKKKLLEIITQRINYECREVNMCEKSDKNDCIGCSIDSSNKINKIKKVFKNK